MLTNEQQVRMHLAIELIRSGMTPNCVGDYVIRLSGVILEGRNLDDNKVRDHAAAVTVTGSSSAKPAAPQTSKPYTPTGSPEDLIALSTFSQGSVARHLRAFATALRESLPLLEMTATQLEFVLTSHTTLLEGLLRGHRPESSASPQSEVRNASRSPNGGK